MTDNTLIFAAVRPWLDSQGFTPQRIAELDAACAAFRAAPDNATVFSAVRHWLDAAGFTPARIAALDGACASFRAVAGAAPPPVAPAPPAAALGDDKYLRVFRHLASQRARPEVVEAMARSFAAAAPRYGQDATKPRIAEFVAQISNETGGFVAFEENLRYSAPRMMQVWGKRIRKEAQKRGISGEALAAQLAGKPEAIANVVYQRPEEGNTQPGDGWRYRGRGALQLTFRNNYRRFGELAGMPLEEHPEIAADPAVSVVIALEFYKQGNVNRWIDAGNFKAARGITNAGSPTHPAPHGLDNVNRLRLRAMEVL